MPATKLIAGKRRHQHEKAGGAQRPVRREHGAKGARLRLRLLPLFGHDCDPTNAISPREAPMPKAVRPGATPRLQPNARAPPQGQGRRPSGSRRSSRALRQPTPSPRASSSTSIPSRCWWRWCSRPRRPMPASTRRRAACSRSADTPKKMVALGVEEVQERIKTIGLYRNKAKNVIALSRAADGRARRPGAARARGAGGAAGRRPQDRQRGAQHRLRRADAGRRHARLPRGASPRSGRRQDAARGGDGLAKGDPRRRICITPTTGSSCTAATSARRASPGAMPVSFATCAARRTSGSIAARRRVAAQRKASP